MKRTPFYRRPGRTGQFSGLRERVIWMIQTRGRPVTGSEIAASFGVTLIEFNRSAKNLTRGTGKVARLEASPTWVTESGIVDRQFNLVSPAKVVVPQGKTRLCTRGAVLHASKKAHQECLDKAARRSRLIKANLYIDEFEAVL